MKLDSNNGILNGRSNPTYPTVSKAFSEEYRVPLTRSVNRTVIPQAA